MFPSKLFITFVSLPCKSQSRVSETATGHKERLEVVGVVGGSGVRGRDLRAAAAL